MALDVPGREPALELVREVKDFFGWFKVGLELFISAGPGLLAEIKAEAPGSLIFLDLKIHDIPATAARAAAAAQRQGADLLTVHAQGGEEMMTAAVQAAPGLKIAAVTLLTSLLPSSLEELASQYREDGQYALFLAQRAVWCGCQAAVASPLETAGLREKFGPGLFLVTPGIRPVRTAPAGGRTEAASPQAARPADDQKRTGTPREALAAGADLLVVGRPVRDAPSPSLAAGLLLDEILDWQSPG
jgi:orotidine-5'-phosphate decarboxylase